MYVLLFIISNQFIPFPPAGEDLPQICDVEGKCNTPQKILSCKLACCCRILNQATSFVSAKLEDGSCLVSTNVAPSHTSASSFQHINAGQDGAYRLHTATYLSRPDLACLIHLTHPEALEVSSLKYVFKAFNISYIFIIVGPL